MKKRFFSIWLFSLIVVTCLFCGCEKEKTKKAQEDGAIQLYYFNTEENGFVTVPYDPTEKKPLDTSKELIHMLSDTTDDNTNQYKPSLEESIMVNKVFLEETELIIDFSAGYEQLPSEKEILCRTALVKTLIQVDGVDCVLFTINGESLKDVNGANVGPMDNTTFIIDKNKIYEEERKVVLYYPNREGEKLTEVEETIKADGNQPLEQAALYALKTPSLDNKLRAALPSDLEILSTQIFDHICYVDLSKEMISSLSGINEKVMIYSMVNTIIGIGNATGVQFTIEGEKYTTLHDFDGFEKTMTFNYSLCEEQ